MEIKQVLGPSVRRTQTGRTGARVRQVQYNRSAATLPPEITDDAFRALVLPCDRSVTHIGNEVRSIRKDQEV